MCNCTSGNLWIAGSTPRVAWNDRRYRCVTDTTR